MNSRLFSRRCLSLAALPLVLLQGCGSSGSSHASSAAASTSMSKKTSGSSSNASDHTTSKNSTSSPVATDGRLEKFTVTGVASKLSGTLLVWLPRGYDPKSSRTYPVIEAMHGFPGHPESILPSTHLDRTIDSEVAAHKMAAPIVVMPQENMPPSRDTECIDAPGEATGTWLGDDVPAFVRSHFHTMPGRDAWATWGFSAGGWCAAVVASQHQQTFGAASSLVGYFKPDFEPDYVPFGASSPQYQAADLVAMMKNSPPNIAYYVLAAEEDDVSYPTSSQFVAAAKAQKSADVDSHLLSKGNHDAGVWLPYVGDSLTFLTRLPGFQVSS